LLIIVNFSIHRFHRVVQQPQFTMKEMMLWKYGTVVGDIQAHFQCACVVAAISELPVNTLTTPLAQATP